MGVNSASSQAELSTASEDASASGAADRQIAFSSGDSDALRRVVRPD